VGLWEEDLADVLAGFAAGVVPFGEVKPGWVGESFGCLTECAPGR